MSRDPILSRSVPHERVTPVKKDGVRVFYKKRRISTNEEIMKAALKKRGYVPLRLYPQIYGPDNKPYGYHGVSWTVHLASIADVEKLFKRINTLLEELAEGKK